MAKLKVVCKWATWVVALLFLNAWLSGKDDAVHMLAIGYICAGYAYYYNQKQTERNHAQLIATLNEIHRRVAPNNE